MKAPNNKNSAFGETSLCGQIPNKYQAPNSKEFGNLENVNWNFKQAMNIFTVITAVIVIGIVWGGFAFFLSWALKYEKLKKDNGKE